MKAIFIDNELGMRLREIRKTERYTIKEMAEKLDTVAVTYSNYERGSRRMPEKFSQKLNKVFGISEVWFLTGEGRMKSTDKPKSSISDIKELKDEVMSLKAQMKYLQTMYLNVVDRLNKLNK